MYYNKRMRFLWEEKKNELLKKSLKISFEQVVLSIENRQIVDVIEHPNQEKKGQIFILIDINNYIYVVSAIFSDSNEECHLKTIYPSRKYTDEYLRNKK
jgi:hypothetical protein